MQKLTSSQENSDSTTDDGDGNDTESKLENEAELVQWVYDQYEKCKGQRAQQQKAWEFNLMSYGGDQWKRLISGKIETPIAPTWRSKLVTNLIRPAVRQQITRMTNQKPSVSILPVSTSEDDIFAAQAGEAVWDSLYSRKRFHALYQRAAFWVVTTGNGFMKTYWDSTKVDKTFLAVNPMLEKPVPAQGDIEYGVITPFNLFVPDLLIEDIEDQPFIIEAYTRPVLWVNTVWKDKLKAPVEADCRAQSEIFNTAYWSANGNDGSAQPDAVLVMECWMKPGAHPACPKGAMLTVIGKQLLQYTEGLPYSHGEYPIAHWGDIPTGKFYRESVVTDLIPLNQQYNRTRNQIIESMLRTARTQMAYVEGSLDPNRITSRPGEMWPIKPGYQMPVPIPAQPIPQFVTDELRILKQDFEDISGQHAVSRGQTQGGVVAACVDPATMALTRKGWASYTDLSVGDEILTYDRVSGTSSFKPIRFIEVHDYAGTMYAFNSKYFNALATPDHKWLVTKRSGKQAIVESQHLAHNDSIRFTAALSGGERPVKAEFAELLGWILSDGHFDSAGGIKIHQSYKVNEYKCERIEDVLIASGIDYRLSRNKSTEMVEFYIRKQDSIGIRELIPGKRINVELFTTWHPELIQAVVDGLIGGDGHISETGQTLFFTKWRTEAEAFQTLNALLGKSVGISEIASETSTNGSMYFCTVKIDRYNKAIVGRSNLRQVPYDGVVWCPNVEGGLWFAKRGDSIFLTHNTAINYLQEQDDTMNYTAYSSGEFFVEKIGKQSLAIVADMWDIPRIVRTIGTDRSFDVIELKGAQIANGLDLRVEAGSSLAKSKTARQALLMDMAKMGFITPEQLLDLIDMGGTQKLTETLRVDMYEAQRENLKLKKLSAVDIEAADMQYQQSMIPDANGYVDPNTMDPGTGMTLQRPCMVPVHDWQNHQVHIDVHNRFRKSQEFEFLDPIVQKEFQSHILLHQVQLISAQQRMMAQMGGGPVPGMMGPEMADTMNDNAAMGGEMNGNGPDQQPPGGIPGGGQA